MRFKSKDIVDISARYKSKKVKDIMDLNEKSFLLFAATHYNNPCCSDIEEFYTDLQIPVHLKKLFTRYHVNKDLKERLIINHIISFFNVFQARAGIKILFYKLAPEHHGYLKTFLMYLNRCPDEIIVNNERIDLKKIPNDLTILYRLKQGNRTQEDPE